jgi:hypothetical protein
MKRSGALSGCLLLCGLGALAQQDAPKVVVNVEGFRYPPIAASARIEGDVVVEISASGQRLIASAHPILEDGATRNLATWAVPPVESGKYIVTYHFELLEGGGEAKTVPIGSKFGRFFRRLIGAPTEKVVNTCYPSGDPTADPPARYTLVKYGDVKIDVFVGTLPRCWTPEASHTAITS